MTSSNKKTLREACPALAEACLTACTLQLHSFSPDETAQAAFLGVQTHVRLKLSGSNQMRTLVKAGMRQAAGMSPLSITQLMFAAVSTRVIKPAELQV